MCIRAGVYGLAGFGYIITATYLPLFLSGSLQSVDPVHLWALFGLAAAPAATHRPDSQRNWPTRRDCPRAGLTDLH
uniref:YbfB/YjiJ family MFS transporter n=1 Tax=Klebsiella pneumoniae TaxID=573 RepID=UPI0035C8243E